MSLESSIHDSDLGSTFRDPESHGVGSGIRGPRGFPYIGREEIVTTEEGPENFGTFEKRAFLDCYVPCSAVHNDLIYVF